MMVLESDLVVRRITIPGDLAPSIAEMKDGSLVNLWAAESGHALLGFESEFIAAEAVIAAMILAWRARRALEDIPGMILHTRALISAPERGEWIPEAWAPLRISAVAQVDAVYALLLRARRAWASILGVRESVILSAWRTRAGIRGLRPNVTPGDAARLAREQTTWLLDHEDGILEHADLASEFHAAVVDAAAKLRAFVPPAKRRPARLVLRPCPRCLERAVTGDWAPTMAKGDVLWHPDGRVGENGALMLVEVVSVSGVDPGEVSIRCSGCGWRPELKPSMLARWLA